jgi:hypothetical protein
MADVINFIRSKNAAEIHAFEDSVRTIANLYGYGSEAAEWVIQDFKTRPFRFEHNEEVGLDEIPAGAEPHLAKWSQKIKAAYQRLMGEWFIQIVKLECELWAAKFSK